MCIYQSEAFVECRHSHLHPLLFVTNRHQRRNDQTQVKSFAVDKPFVNMDERGVSEEIGNKALSGGRSQGSTDEDSGDLAKT